MNKIKYLIPGLALCALLFACHKSEGGSEEIDDKPAQVRLSTNMRSTILATKAGIDNWNQQKLYVYAFPTGKIPAAADSILINNIEATAPESGEEGRIDIMKDSTYFYYSADKRTYDFFAYYVDSAATLPPVPDITPNDNVTLPIHIDGSHDIMLATTNKEKDIEKAGGGLTPTEVYSAYSARRNVVPNLIFNHQLSRFVFRIIAGSEEGEKVKINSITLKSCSSGDLVIVSKNGTTGIDDPSDTTNLYLKPLSEIPEFRPKFKPTFEDTDKIGESIMVIPDKVHHLEIKMQQYEDSARTKAIGDPFAYNYDLTTKLVETTIPHPDNKFLKGYRYNVNVVVYGREVVIASVTLSKWEDGGTITIDNEKEWGDEPKYGIKAWNKDSTASPYLYFYGDIAKNTPVKVWDKANNDMIFAPIGTYTFVKDTLGIKGVVLGKKGTTDTTIVSSVTPKL